MIISFHTHAAISSYYYYIFASQNIEPMSALKTHLIKHIKPHQDILIFVLTIVIFHTLWKLGRHSEDFDQYISFYGIDCSSFFNNICEKITQIVHTILSSFESNIIVEKGNTLRFTDNGAGTRIVWGCSGVKEIFMTALVIITARGNIMKKLWYIPLGLILVTLLNIIRITSLNIIIHWNKELFDFAHLYVFRFIMYAGIFLIWLTWIEKIVSKKDNN